MVRWEKVRRPSVCRARFAFVFFRVFLFTFYRVRAREYSEGACGVFFYLFKRYLFLIFFGGKGRRKKSHKRAKVTPPLSLFPEYEYNRYFLYVVCDVSD